MSCKTFEESPSQVIVRGRRGVREGTLVCGECVALDGSWKYGSSCIVRRSASIWVGCQSEDNALMTGTSECCASTWSIWSISDQWIDCGLYEMAHFDFRMSSHSSKQALAHATKNTCRVFNGLIDAKLDILPTKEQSATPQEHSGRFGRDASPGTSLRKKEGNGTTCQGLCRDKQRPTRPRLSRIEGFMELFRRVL